MPSTGPRWRGKANDIDPTHHQGPVAFGEAKGVVVIIKDGYIRGYRMTKEKSLSKYDPLPSSQGGPTGLRMQIKVTAVKGSFHTRLTSAQTDLMLEALRTLQGWGYSDEALAVQLNAGQEEIDLLAERLRGDHKTDRDFTLTGRELHVIHSALTAVATTFISGGGFSEEGFYNKTSFFRENFDAMASSIVRAVDEATAP
ncbi:MULTISPECIES: hypothetical protein [Streptomyces]|uniref:Uncharacterized protein n=1 Tax=Streptomyces flavovirens TaxID=52258 RepID=A0ABV8N0X3_9ACTN|nr:hypothetical protein [Streptomyces sp. MBT51]MBK3596534.1 hypothetical protein [Streptomyces sp. MBT51]